MREASRAMNATLIKRGVEFGDPRMVLFRSVVHLDYCRPTYN